jgi:hypothetical protein
MGQCAGGIMTNGLDLARALSRVLPRSLTRVKARWPQAGALMGVLSGFGLAALAQAEAVAVHLKNVHMMGEPIEDGAGQAF